MPDDRPTNRITLEDLLRVKRAERPPADFWNRFESELRAKQLAAIVEKPRWWKAWAMPAPAWRAPLGVAVAVGLVSIAAIHEYRSPSAVAVEQTVAAIGPQPGIADSKMPTAAHVAPEIQSAVASVPVLLPSVSHVVVEDTAVATIPSAAMALTLESPDRFSTSRPEDESLVGPVGRGLALSIDLPEFASGFIAGEIPAGASTVQMTAAKSEPLAQLQTPRDQGIVALLRNAGQGEPAFTVMSRRGTQKELSNRTIMALEGRLGRL